MSGSAASDHAARASVSTQAPASLGSVPSTVTDSIHSPSNVLVLSHLDLIRRADKMRIPPFTRGDDIEIWLKRYDAITARVGLNDSLKAEYLPNFLASDIAEFICMHEHAFNYTGIRIALIANFQLDPSNLQKKRLLALRQFKQGAMPMRFYKTEFQQRLNLLPKAVPERDLLRTFHGNLSPELQSAFKTEAINLKTWDELADRCVKYEDLYFGPLDDPMEIDAISTQPARHRQKSSSKTLRRIIDNSDSRLTRISNRRLAQAWTDHPKSGIQMVALSVVSATLWDTETRIAPSASAHRSMPCPPKLPASNLRRKLPVRFPLVQATSLPNQSNPDNCFVLCNTYVPQI